MELFNPSDHPDWLKPHSMEWYKQLGDLNGKYEYPWHSTLDMPNGESIFDEAVLKMVQGNKALDVGCGHGEYTIQFSANAKEIIGFDVTDYFVQNEMKYNKNNVSFVVGNSKEGLPFEQDTFDCAYIRKGPTSAYPLLHQVLKEGGQILGLHPGDDSGKELPHLFPKLFNQSNGNTLDLIKQRLNSSDFSYVDIEVVNSMEFLQSPIDVIKLCCFGQKQTVYEAVVANCLPQINKTFKENTTTKGLPITFSRYIVRATV